MQLEMFPSTYGGLKATRSPNEVTPATDIAPVARTPGWVLVAGSGGVLGFHRVTTFGKNGTLLTRCGLVGRPIREEAATIQPCPTCAEEG